MKAVALAQLANGGAQAISLNAIAKEFGVSGPALYRYYGSRDELLNELVIDAYRDLSDALARAGTAAARLPTPQERMRELGYAYRRWARAQPHRYELLFKPPFPGYDAHAEPISEAAGALMVAALGIFEDGHGDAGTRPDPDRIGYVVRVWSRIHGIVSLELGGAYSAMEVDAEALFAEEMRGLTGGIGE
ncbi:TetR/AcrR family transcriptional regulator [Pseudonocardia sp. DLS-67]